MQSYKVHPAFASVSFAKWKVDRDKIFRSNVSLLIDHGPPEENAQAQDIG